MAFMYITEQGAVLKKAGQRLVVEKDRKKLLDIPASKIEGVLIFGNVQFTTQAVRLMFESGIEMALFSSKGRLLGQLTSPVTKNISLRQAQYARHGDHSFVLSLSKIIVRAKLNNCLKFVREFSYNHPATELDKESEKIAELCSQIDSQKELPSLLGLEGAGGRVYFRAFGKMVRQSFVFTKRQRRPAPDPVHALLSLCYTMLYNEIGSLLDGLGFDPYLGFYHQPHYGHATLASDLMEEFRVPLTDRFTLNLINNRVLSKDDFYLHSASGSVYLNDEARKLYFIEYERFVTRPMPASEDGTEANYRETFRRQAERLKNAITDGIDYLPYEFR